MKRQFRQQGVTLVEAIIAIAILSMVSVALYAAAAGVFSVARAIHTKTVLAEIASQRMEFIRNLAYANIGTTGGIPSGVISPSETITRNGQSFLIQTTIRNIDNPADGVLGGTPNDLSPADNKFVHITVSCPLCDRPQSVEFTSTIAPKNLETENGNGALIIKVVTANGAPIPGAQVSVRNESLIPKVAITDTTDSHGILAVVDAPPSAQGYQVSVTKAGYSTEQTFPEGAVDNPTPVKRNLTVAANAVTQDTFAIDLLSSVDLSLYDLQCTPLESLNSILMGSKLIGTPSLLKHSYPMITDIEGKATNAVEWDSYTFSLQNGYHIAGLSVVNPFLIAPGVSLPLQVLVHSGTESGWGVSVFDSSGTQITNPTITLTQGGNSISMKPGVVAKSIISGTSSLESADSGISSGSASTTLAGGPGSYVASGSATSAVIDMGQGAVLDSIAVVGTTPQFTTAAFQVASSVDGATWEFHGPDGTDQTYYTSEASVSTVGRYLKYKLFLTSSNPGYAPIVTSVIVRSHPVCMGMYQSYIEGLASGTYQLEVAKTGFATQTKTITIPSSEYEAITLTVQ